MGPVRTVVRSRRELRDLIRRMSLANPLWGAPHIVSELSKIGIELPKSTVAKYMVRQRVPELFSTIKLAVDRDHRPGRLILTGSANILMIPRVSDSLAGRMEIIKLHPLSRCEVLGRRSGFIADLFAGAGMMHQAERLGGEIAEIVAAGGYPAALSRSSERGRTNWHCECVETIAQRDIKDLARIREIEVLPQIVALAAARTAQLFNLAELAGPFRLSKPRQASWSEERVQFHHFRTKEDAEVDAVLERAGRRIAGVEVKLSGTVVAKDFRGLKKIREAVGGRFTAGVVLYDGEITIPFGEGLFAVPLSRIWTEKT